MCTANSQVIEIAGYNPCIKIVACHKNQANEMESTYKYLCSWHRERKKFSQNQIFLISKTEGKIDIIISTQILSVLEKNIKV